jgi:hypothetical protein
MKARVFAQYSDGCFCQRPELAPHLHSVVIPLDPRFEFAAAARDLAAKLGAENFRLNKRSTGRSACAELPVACRHRARQAIHITWEIASCNA